MKQPERPTRYEFWMVWRENGYQPSHRHKTKSSALNEATRLAKLNPGDVFFVLKATAGVVTDDPDIKRVKFIPDEIPF